VGVEVSLNVGFPNTRWPSFGEIYDSTPNHVNCILRPARDNAAKSLSVGVANGEYSRKG
jgi:hypothetical protein